MPPERGPQGKPGVQGNQGNQGKAGERGERGERGEPFMEEHTNGRRLFDQRHHQHPQGALGRRHFRDLRAARARIVAMWSGEGEGEITARWPVRIAYILAGAGVAVALALTGSNIAELDKQQAKLASQGIHLKAQDEANIRALIRNCRRVNVTNAFARGVTQEGTRANDIATVLFPILDCDVAARDQKGEGIPLPLPEQEKYVSLIQKERLPVVEGGHVIGSVPFPPAGPSGGPEASAGG